MSGHHQTLAAPFRGIVFTWNSFGPLSPALKIRLRAAESEFAWCVVGAWSTEEESRNMRAGVSSLCMFVSSSPTRVLRAGDRATVVVECRERWQKLAPRDHAAADEVHSQLRASELPGRAQLPEAVGLPQHERLQRWRWLWTGRALWCQNRRHRLRSPGRCRGHLGRRSCFVAAWLSPVW